jgi:hypothetical protein
LPYVLGAGGSVLGFLPQYAKEEGLQNGARYYLLLLIDYVLDWCGVVHEMPPAIFNGLVVAFLGLLALWAWWRQPRAGKESPEAERRWIFPGYVLALAFSVLLSSYYPWYYCWLAFFLCFVSSPATLLLTLIAWPLYRSLLEQSGDDLFRFQSRVFLPFFALLILIWIMRRLRSRTAAKN